MILSYSKLANDAEGCSIDYLIFFLNFIQLAILDAKTHLTHAGIFC